MIKNAYSEKCFKFDATSKDWTIIVVYDYLTFLKSMQNLAVANECRKISLLTMEAKLTSRKMSNVYITGHEAKSKLPGFKLEQTANPMFRIHIFPVYFYKFPGISRVFPCLTSEVFTQLFYMLFINFSSDPSSKNFRNSHSEFSWDTFGEFSWHPSKNSSPILQ